MALTATAQPVPTPSWDETIVPALRKRLQDESRMLTKRLSAASIPSGEESPRSIPDFGPQTPSRRAPQRAPPRQATSPTPARPSAIPRPSGQYSEAMRSPRSPVANQQAALGMGQAPTRPVRTRTRSTPGIPPPSTSRSASPAVVKSRIPTPKTSVAPSAVPNGRSVKSSTPTSPTVPTALYIAANGANGSHSSFEHAILRGQPSAEIMREQPPFDAARLSLSQDDADRPFEHWYRGEAMRNGGVGEFRVGKHAEMLEIATFGYKLSAPPQRTTNRESWVPIDDFDLITGSQRDRVLDEGPPTDLDPDAELSEFDDPRLTPTAGWTAHEPEPTIVSKPSLARLVAETPVPPRAVAVTPAKKAATPAQQFAKKAAQPAKKATRHRSRSVVDMSREGDAPTADEQYYYEMDAIPTWTQPVEGRNWDDVVLPAVAKKLGLQEGYVKADGSTPKAKRTREGSERVAPAPGTFGIDDAKQYRDRIPLVLDEFGRVDGGDTSASGGPVSDREELHQTEPILRPLSPPRVPSSLRTHPSPAPSPAPFSQFSTGPRPAKQQMVQQQPQPAPVPPPQFIVEKRREPPPEEESCCRCVIM